MGPLRTDISRQERLLINGVQIDVCLRPNSDAFTLMYERGARTYTFDIGKAVLHLTHVSVNPSLMLAHAEVLKRQAAQYFIQKSLIRTYTIAKGSYNFEMENIFQGNTPSRVLVGLVTSDAYSGDCQSNPFDFSHHNVSNVKLYFDGIVKPYDINLNYRNNQISEGYSSIFKSFGKWGAGSQIVALSDYPSGYCLYSFSLQEPTPYGTLLKKSHSRLSIGFETPPGQPLTLIVYSLCPDIIQIDESRVVI